MSILRNRVIGAGYSRRFPFTTTAIRSLLPDLVLDLLGHGVLLDAAIHPCRLLAVVAYGDLQREAFIAHRTLLITLFAPKSTGPAAIGSSVHIK